MCWLPLCQIVSAWRIRVLTQDGVKQLLELCFANGTFQQPSNVCVKTCNAMLEWSSVEHATHQLWRFVLSKLRLHFLAFRPKMSTAELRCEHTHFDAFNLQPDVLLFFGHFSKSLQFPLSLWHFQIHNQNGRPSAPVLGWPKMKPHKTEILI